MGEEGLGLDTPWASGEVGAACGCPGCCSPAATRVSAGVIAGCADADAAGAYSECQTESQSVRFVCVSGATATRGSPDIAIMSHQHVVTHLHGLHHQQTACHK